jgi:hypothetical protein
MNRIVIPLGEECYTCQSIDGKFSNSIRQQGFPFDYVGHTFVEKIYDNFLDLLANPYDFKINKNDFDITQFGDKYYFVHKKYGFKYWHDTSSDTNKFEASEVNAFMDKYSRRYKRLYDILQSKTITPIFLSVNHFDNIYNKITKPAEIYKLYELLYSYNKNVKFIAINYGSEIINTNGSNLSVINLPVNYNLPFSESKAKFTETLYDCVKNWKF